MPIGKFHTEHCVRKGLLNDPFYLNSFFFRQNNSFLSMALEANNRRIFSPCQYSLPLGLALGIFYM